ncbi:hypothetical protein HGO40_18835 [Pseudomonas sp. CG7]|uniref:hypothetical protein n=1 Tax=Pseudomonas sp. CG7 TaxID=191007 RepID=UPI00203321DC|nr:hypothetical protein [Pseudomonas sp. CG7]MCM2462508.1 hypothetical protein [Pseudomonas sp. CG7]
MKQTTGEARAINRQSARVGVYVSEEEGHTVLELGPANDVDIGDVMEWDTTALGTQTYRNLEVQLLVGS